MKGEKNNRIRNQVSFFCSTFNLVLQNGVVCKLRQGSKGTVNTRETANLSNISITVSLRLLSLYYPSLSFFTSLEFISEQLTPTL